MTCIVHIVYQPIPTVSMSLTITITISSFIACRWDDRMSTCGAGSYPFAFKNKLLSLLIIASIDSLL